MNKLTKVLVGGAAFIATVGAGVYVKHVYDTQHTINVPMQVSGAYGQNLNNVVGCFWLGATSRSVYEEVRHFTTSMNPIDPTTNAPQYPLWNMLDEVDKSSKEWARKYFNQFTPEQMETTPNLWTDDQVIATCDVSYLFRLRDHIQDGLVPAKKALWIEVRNKAATAYTFDASGRINNFFRVV